MEIKIRAYRDGAKYDYVTTVAGRDCTGRHGIAKGIAVNVCAITEDGVATIWTESPTTGPYKDTVPFATLRELGK